MRSPIPPQRPNPGRLVLLGLLSCAGTLGLVLGLSAFFSQQLPSPRGQQTTGTPDEVERLLAASPRPAALPPSQSPVDRGSPSTTAATGTTGTETLACPEQLTAVSPARAAQLRTRQEPEIPTPAAVTNFGERERTDRSPARRPVEHTPQLIVLHETVIPVGEAIALFQTAHSDDGAQVSYHLLIGQDGRLYRIVPDEKRAFGAGNSAFGGRAVTLNPDLPSSVNNIALHVSLETPADGNNDARSHSGYSDRQYQVLAQVVGDWMRRWRIPATSITTHQQIDRDGRKKDPRSLDSARFYAYLSSRLSQAVCPRVAAR